MPIKVAIIDDHPLAVSGLWNMLANKHNIQVTETYECGTSLLLGLQHSQPDVLLLDIRLPDYSGQELAVLIRKKYPQIRILVITSLDAPTYVKSMLSAGCSGYVLKNIRTHALVQAIEEVYNGTMYIEPTLKEQMIQYNQQTAKSKNHIPILTRREKEVLQLITEEYTNQEIADKLFLSLRTVENHRFSLLQKLGVKNAVGLVRMALQMGLAK